MSSVVRTRMAPSPTGQMHIGSMRTLLYNWAWARKNQGQFVLRIEDTDQKRLVANAQEQILQVIKDYGFSWDEGPDIGGPYAPYVQSQRLSIYQQYIQKLLKKGLAYYCFCSPSRLDQLRSHQRAQKMPPKYDRRCLSLSPSQIKKNLAAGRPYVIRLKVPPPQTITCSDLIRGPIKFNSADIDDQVLIKSDGMPTYHFAVVVDDHLMKISHVIRGDEWLSSFPKQIILYQYFGWKPPVFVHLPVFLDPQGRGKMSKRRGSVSARSFLDRGYLPAALNNFLMLLGWNPGTDQEIFSLDQFVSQFSLNRLHLTQPAFNQKKLDYLNGYYIRQLSPAKLAKLLKPFLPQIKPSQLKLLIPLLQDRIHKLSDAQSLTDFVHQDVNYHPSLLLQRQTSPQLAQDMLSQAKQTLSSLSRWQPDFLQKSLLDLIKKNNWNTGQFFMVFRVAVCGSPFTLPVVDCLPIIGRQAALRKLDLALGKLKTL